MRVSPFRHSDGAKLRRRHYREQSYSSRSLTLQPREVLAQDYIATGDPSTDSLFLQACASRAAGNFPSAVKSYEKYLSSHPTSMPAVLNLGVCYMKLGQVAQARRLYIQTENCSIDVRFNYAVASLMLGKRFQAMEALRECKEKATGSLAADVSWALRLLESESPSKTPITEATDSEVEFSMVIRHSTRSQPSKKHTLSLCSKPTHQRFPSGGVFRSVEHYAPSPQVEFRPVFSYVPRSRNSPKRTKTTFSIPSRARTGSSGEQSKSSIAGHNSQASANRIEGCQRQPSPRDKIRRQGSLVEEDLEDEQSLRRSGLDLCIERELHENAAKMQQDLDRECERQLIPDTAEVPQGNKLRPEDIERVRSEMQKESFDRDLRLLSRLVERLKFFGRFKPEVREEILQVGGHILVRKDDFVFRQGDTGTHVYAVLRGSIIVWRHAMEYGADPLIVYTLYDGDSFGELSLFTLEGGKQGRSASCQAVCDTDLFFLPKEHYHRIMIREVEIGLQAKLSMLLGLPFFDGAHEFALVPLAATLTPLRFKIGQYILRTGETPKGLYIIVSGRCNVYSEGYTLRPITVISSTATSPRGNSWSVTPGKHRRSIKEHVVTREMMDADPVLVREVTAFLRASDLSTVLEKHSIHRERKLECVLAESHYFSGRCLVSPSHIEPCKYSIVADSAEVAIYLVTSGQVPLLGERLAAQVLYFLSRRKDVDCPPDLSRDKIREDFIRWSAYKDRVVTKVLRRNVR